MGEVIQLQGDQRKDVQEFLVDKKEGLELDAKTIKVKLFPSKMYLTPTNVMGRSMASDPKDLSNTPLAFLMGSRDTPALMHHSCFLYQLWEHYAFGVIFICFIRPYWTSSIPEVMRLLPVFPYVS